MRVAVDVDGTGVGTDVGVSVGGSDVGVSEIGVSVGYDVAVGTTIGTGVVVGYIAASGVVALDPPPWPAKQTDPAMTTWRATTRNQNKAMPALSTLPAALNNRTTDDVNSVQNVKKT